MNEPPTTAFDGNDRFQQARSLIRAGGAEPVTDAELKQPGLWVTYDANRVVRDVNDDPDIARDGAAPDEVVEWLPEDTRRARFWRLGPFSGGWSPTKNGLGAASGWTLYLLRWRGLNIEIGWHPERRAVSDAD